jgi:hypothetical protein
LLNVPKRPILCGLLLLIVVSSLQPGATAQITVKAVKASCNQT